jgi:imidazolonepropionase-like amidohydrolase
MQSTVIVLCVCCIFGVYIEPSRASSQSSGQSKRLVIAASEILDGKGGVLHNTRMVIDGSTIAAIDPKAGPVDYDLRSLTVLPGWIDAHVHITWSFGPDGKNAGEGGQPRRLPMLPLRMLG